MGELLLEVPPDPFENRSIKRRIMLNVKIICVGSLKESYLKAIGTGFSDNAKNIVFLSLKNPIESNNKNYSFTVGERDNFVFAVCEKK